MTDPHPFNGRPYYCEICGAGYGEFVACEKGDCRLESWASSVQRSLDNIEKHPVALEAEANKKKGRGK